MRVVIDFVLKGRQIHKFYLIWLLFYSTSGTGHMAAPGHKHVITIEWWWLVTNVRYRSHKSNRSGTFGTAFILKYCNFPGWYFETQGTVHGHSSCAVFWLILGIRLSSLWHVLIKNSIKLLILRWPFLALRETLRSHLGYALKGLRADGSADVSSVREVTGHRSKYALGATC